MEDGEVKVKPIMNIGVTFDHRVIDGIHAARIGAQFKEIFADPDKYFLINLMNSKIPTV